MDPLRTLPLRTLPLVTTLALLAACGEDAKPDVNTTPTLSSVRITSDADPATPSSTLTCTAFSLDPDGDALTTDIVWSLESDGGEVGTGETLALTPGLVAPDDVVVCTVTVSDPEGATADGTDSLQLGNADPTLSELGVSADSADGLVYNDSTVSCAATATDPDDRGVETVYSWRNDTTGDDLGSEAVLALTAELATPGDALLCTVTATDADAGAATDSVSVAVENRPPETGGITFTPAAPTSLDDVSCAAASPSDLDEDGVGVAYSWQRDGAAAGVGDAIAAPHGVGDVLTCVVTVTDDHGAETVASADVAVVNTAPTVDGVTVTPTEARVGETLTCAATASDVDGETPTLSYAWTDGSTGDTYTVAETDDPGDTLTCTATATDGALATAEGSADATVLNTEPVVSTVGISPASANNDDVLTCTATATDADGDAPGLTYAWSGSGAGSLGSGSTVDLSTTTVASLETVTCTVTAADPDGGSADDSADLVVANRDPSVTASLSPATGATRSDTLTCTAAVADDDGDSVSVSYSWTVDGVAETSASSTATSSLLSGVFTRGQVVTCTAIADDAKGGSAASVATTTIANTPPDISTPTLAPATVYTDDTLTANVSTSDDDGDTVGVTYEWFVDGTSVQDGADNTLSGAVHFDKDDAVYVVATADDASDTTSATSSVVTVANSAPTAPVVTIDPSEPVEGDDLVCEVTTASTDADGDPVTYTMDWTVDTSHHSAALTTTWSDDTIDGPDTVAAEVWECTATPSDGDDDGSTASDAVEIGGWREWSTSAQPAGVYLGSMAFDPNLDAVLHFGGQTVDNCTTSNETWTWDGEQWDQLFPATNPDARTGAGLAWDSTLGGLVMFGGQVCDGSYEGVYYNDTWLWDGADWTQLNPNNPPSARRSELSTHPGGGVFLHGGQGCKDQRCAYGDTYVLSGGDWVELNPTGGPGNVEGHSLSYDEVDGLVLLFDVGQPDDVWTWDGTAWASVSSPGGPAADGMPLRYNSTTETAMVFSGLDGGAYLVDSWFWSAGVWTLGSASAPPDPRNGAAMAYDSSSGGWLMFAGQSTATSSTDPYNFHADTWTFH